MGQLNNRVKRLEKAVKPQRCDTCRDWPDERVVVEMSEDLLRYESPPKPPETPEQCPDCGWRPHTMLIHVKEDDPEPIAVPA